MVEITIEAINQALRNSKPLTVQDYMAQQGYSVVKEFRDAELARQNQVLQVLSANTTSITAPSGLQLHIHEGEAGHKGWTRSTAHFKSQDHERYEASINSYQSAMADYYAQQMEMQRASFETIRESTREMLERSASRAKRLTSDVVRDRCGGSDLSSGSYGGQTGSFNALEESVITFGGEIVA